MSLQDEIDRHRREIYTDSYQMSIGELVNIYKDGELDIHPEFQRFYRWTIGQKSRWIESILLGIPLPSIFVAQREDGVWDLIDGLQRISTILELMGELKDADGNLCPPLVLEGTKLLPSLEGKRWESDNPDEALTDDQKRYIKRSKLTINIILRESHEASKFELFQRLNTGGTFLSDQELRSALILGTNPAFFQWFSKLTASESFQTCIALSERQIDEQYDRELAMRFLVLRRADPQSIVSIKELSEYLTDEAKRLAQDDKFDYEGENRAFHSTFDLLARALESDAFRRYDRTRDRFIGPFLLSAFEVIALGIGYHYEAWRPEDKDEIVRRVKEIVWKEPEFLTSTGQRATQRIPRTLARGREVFRR